MRTRGDQAEQQAQRYLCQQGLRWVASNVRSRFGEIDLIMQDQQCLVFIEVKFRQNNHFGGAISAVTPTKQRKIHQTALWYLQQQGTLDIPCRFDVVAITGEHIHWLKNVF
ncbi:MAG: YraN family protein [Ferrimonas sp.]